MKQRINNKERDKSKDKCKEMKEGKREEESLLGQERGRRDGRGLRVFLFCVAGLMLWAGWFGCGSQDLTDSSFKGGDSLAASDDEFFCPGSPSYVHASCVVKAIANAPCAKVLEEAQARVNGQFDAWVDPHNNGTYSKITQLSEGKFTLSRLTGDKKYTDKIAIQLTPMDGGRCEVRGCSESQVTSVADFSTNYCNIHNLYCGTTSDPKCKPVKHDFASTEELVKPSIGATASVSKCVTLH